MALRVIQFCEKAFLPITSIQNLQYFLRAMNFQRDGPIDFFFGTEEISVIFSLIQKGGIKAVLIEQSPALKASDRKLKVDRVE